jgi:hypothetical protein
MLLRACYRKQGSAADETWAWRAFIPHSNIAFYSKSQDQHRENRPSNVDLQGPLLSFSSQMNQIDQLPAKTGNAMT